uniref:Uncharacterized protein n=1 Tax=Caenorhabditis tropicalis TaxID=1561998 RepID=A0A1I7TI11_9PELO
MRLPSTEAAIETATTSPRTIQNLRKSQTRETSRKADQRNLRTTQSKEETQSKKSAKTLSKEETRRNPITEISGHLNQRREINENRSGESPDTSNTEEDSTEN